jgi:protein arginine kinase activator
MSCDDCGNPKPVNIKISINGKNHQIAWTQSEAMQNGFHSPFDQDPFPLGEIVATALKKNLPVKFNNKENPRCPNCGLSFLELLQVGRIGCADCYRAFGEQMDALLEKIHGTAIHSGEIMEPKVGSTKPVKKKISKKDRLRLELKKAIETEDYENAARLRDKLKALETVRK